MDFGYSGGATIADWLAEYSQYFMQRARIFLCKALQLHFVLNQIPVYRRYPVLVIYTIRYTPRVGCFLL